MFMPSMLLQSPMTIEEEEEEKDAENILMPHPQQETYIHVKSACRPATNS